MGATDLVRKKPRKSARKLVTGKDNRSTSRVNSKPNWKKEEPSFTMNTICEPILPSEEAKTCATPLDFFMLFFNNELIDHIFIQMNLYASQNNYPLDMSKEELLVVLGGLLMSGYAKYPKKRMYWSKETDVPTLLSESIRCNRFELILHHLHLNDNTLHDGSDKLFKLRPVLNMLEQSFKKHGGVDENISIDESYGKHYAKQFIRGKPIRFGFKNWALCSSSGYMISFQIYAGKDNEDKVKEFGLDGSVVVFLLISAEIPSDRGFKVFFDNYFTTVKLLSHLAENGICATSILQENRTKKCPLRNQKEMKKEKRGTHDFRSCGNVMLVRWNDNSVVTAGTNYENLVMTTTTRWSSEKKGKVSIPQPLVMSSYNKGMGGVDQLDQMVASYRTRMRHKK